MVDVDIIIPNLRVTSKKQAFQFMSERVAGSYGLNACDLFHVLLEREKIGTTGIGGGVAIPHVKVAGLNEMIGVFARLEKPIDYDAIDDYPVDLIFLLIAPKENGNNQHLKSLSRISRLLRDEAVCQRLRGADTEDSVTAIFDLWWQETQAAA